MDRQIIDPMRLWTCDKCGTVLVDMPKCLCGCEEIWYLSNDLSREEKEQKLKEYMYGQGN